MRQYNIWKFVNRRTAIVIQIFFIYAWLSCLPKTDSFFSVYCFLGLTGIFCLFDNYQRELAITREVVLGVAVFAALFSASVVLGNYALFEPLTALMSIFNMGLCFAGGIFIGANILVCMMNHFPMKMDSHERTHAKRFFWVTFICIVLIDTVYLFATNYPAVVHYDTLAQLRQIMGQSPYSNWTPYWHTKTIEVFFDIGYKFVQFARGGVNAALSFYAICQICFIALCFSYTLVTLYQIGLPKPFLWVSWYVYVLLPYNIVFNVTIGKDVLFGIGLLLFMTAGFRIVTGTGKSRLLNYIAFVVGSFGFSLWRTNGWYVYLLTTLVLLVSKKKKSLLLGTMCCVIACGWFLTNPYFENRVTEHAPLTETMAVPFQQVGRVIVNDRELTDGEEAFLSEIFHMDQVKELYTPNSVDPMKFDVFRHSNYEFFRENIGTFLKIWIQLGLRYPGDYLFAWVDETRGYWNGGYHMGVYDQGIPDNDLGMFHSGGDNVLAKLFAAYFRYIEDPIILEPLKSIGFIVWVVLACWWVNVLKKRKVWLLAVPILIVLVGLWIGTPVFAEFRYGYPVFVVSPLILLTTMFEIKENV